MSDESAGRRVARIAAGSLAIGIAVLALKALAAWLTGSIALYSDALESVVNVVTALVALIAVRLAARPADASLPYGYGKANISRPSSSACSSPWRRSSSLPRRGAASSARAPSPPTPWAWRLGGGERAQRGMGVVSHPHGRRERSPSLLADGQHLATDVISTVGVLIGVLLAIVTGFTQLDAILAALVGLTILWSGWRLIRESVIGLMDVAVDPARLKLIREVIQANADGAIEAHDIRTRAAGRATFIDFHLVVPGAMSVEAAHAICDRIEAKLRDSVAEAQITIHVEPEEKAKHSGIVVV